MTRLEQITQELQNRGVMPVKVPSLEPMRLALELLIDKDLLRPNKTILVAGTNGKGSTSATLETLFRSTGERVGLYTSPHLQTITERIRIQGSSVEPDLFCKAYEKVLQRVEPWEKKGKRLSHFEMLTLMAVWVFFSGEEVEPVERAIFEVGIGGTWDATNAVAHEICVICPLSYDHEALLGPTLENIARNKFGIISKNSTVVHAAFPQEVKALAEKIQSNTRNTWRPAEPATLEVDFQNAEPRFWIQSPWGRAPIVLPGQRGVENTALALTVFDSLGYRVSEHLAALERVNWPGRMEKILAPQAPCPIYLSGDHNPAGSQSLVQLLEYYPRDNLYLLVGIGKQKNCDGILEPLFQLCETGKTFLYLTETPFQTLPLANYGPWLQRAHGASSDPLEALKAIFSKAGPRDRIVVTGSLYLVGKIKNDLLKS